MTDIETLVSLPPAGLRLGPAAAPGATRLLIVAFYVLGQAVVYHVAHVAFVYAHAEGVGGHHHGLFVH